MKIDKIDNYSIRVTKSIQDSVIDYTYDQLLDMKKSLVNQQNRLEVELASINNLIETSNDLGIISKPILRPNPIQLLKR